MAIHKVSDMALIAPLFEGWHEKLVCSTLDGCMGCAWTNDGHTAAQIVNGDFGFFAHGSPYVSIYHIRSLKTFGITGHFY